MNILDVVDCSIGGATSRVVISGAPDLGPGSIHQKLNRFRAEHDHIRTAVVGWPRGNSHMVGALVCNSDTCDVGAIFFTSYGYLSMCCASAMAINATLARLGSSRSKLFRMETPAGVVESHLHDEVTTSTRLIESFEVIRKTDLDVPGIGTLTGDVAWGGNWFFILDCQSIPVDMAYVDQLTHFAVTVQRALSGVRFPGVDAEVDHVALLAETPDGHAACRSFVLRPGRTYDRSASGTAMGARMACLYMRGLLRPGQAYKQESVIGSSLLGSISLDRGSVIPEITGNVYIQSESRLLLDPADPFCYGR